MVVAASIKTKAKSLAEGDSMEDDYNSGEGSTVDGDAEYDERPSASEPGKHVAPLEGSRRRLGPFLLQYPIRRAYLVRAMNCRPSPSCHLRHCRVFVHRSLMYQQPPAETYRLKQLVFDSRRSLACVLNSKPRKSVLVACSSSWRKAKRLVVACTTSFRS